MVEHISATQINTANYCVMRYHLRYYEHEPSLRLSAYVKGSMFHDRINHFWIIDKNTGEKIPKYNSPEEFTKKMQGKWMSIIKADESNKKEGKETIAWQSEGEKWYFHKTQLPEICPPLYEKLREEGPPLFSELRFKFQIGNKVFIGAIDDIRKKDNLAVIRDYKSGHPRIGEMKIKFDPQLTLYAAAVCALVHRNKNLAEKLGFSDEERKRFSGNPIYISDRISTEFFMIESSKTYPSQRTDKHLFEVIEMIDGVKKAIADGNVYAERGSKCDFCDVKYACAERLKCAGQNVPIDIKGQHLFDFATQRYEMPLAEYSLQKPKPKKQKIKQQRRFNWVQARKRAEKEELKQQAITSPSQSPSSS